jgi:hypothetical protein
MAAKAAEIADAKLTRPGPMATRWFERYHEASKHHANKPFQSSVEWRRTFTVL